MIIFDLDEVLADCEHRRHFVIKPAQPECTCDPQCYSYDGQSCPVFDWTNFRPDWQSFYEACDKDLPIEPVVEILDGIFLNSSSPKRFYENVQIWSGRCESIREKTSLWLNEHTLFDGISKKIALKMRPVGDTTSDDQLKEKWLNERCADLISSNIEGKPYPLKHDIDFVFESDPKSIAMWKRRGIFVFNCCQN